ncbi:MAG: phytoene desaturase [Anaerolineales bacterium]|nr:phytoene desaturase [Chloroflexota bacterium]MBL6980900.1 phytoene desaturase [Anaerolineales bacterium]
MQDQRAIVIGAGIGGIAAAIRLAQNGLSVTVIEKCQRAGGRCNVIEKDGHRFDTGPTLFLMPELYKQVFAELGERIEDHVDLVRIDPTYQIHFDDDTIIRPTSDLKAMQDQLEAIEPGSFGEYIRYLNEGRYHYEQAVPNVVQRPFDHWYQFFTLKNLALMLRLKALKKHFNHIRKYFRDERLKIAFTFQNMYMGVNPCEAPAIFSLMQYTELADGVWFPKGGMYSVIQALEKIARKWGVKFVFDTAVEKIVVDGKRATGIILDDGKELCADTIIANADLPYVYRNLLPDDGTADKLDDKKYGCSALVFLLGLDKQYPQLGPHNLFIAEDYRESFDALFDGRTVADEPSFYIHAPARVDPSMAPEGQETLMIAVPIGHLTDDDTQDWPRIKKECKQFVLQRLERLGITDLEEHTKFEISLTPQYWQNRYNLTKGSAHGLSHDLLQMGYMRPNNRHKRYKNLYFVGASTHPGTGLPTVLVSAKLVSERILREQESPQSVDVPAPVIA